MLQQHVNNPPRRVTDLVALFGKGANVSVSTGFEILPVDFRHGDNPFQAYIFLCRYTGQVDGQGRRRHVEPRQGSRLTRPG